VTAADVARSPLLPPIALDEVEAKLAAIGAAPRLVDLILMIPPADRPLAAWRRWSTGRLSDRAIRWWLPYLWSETVALPNAVQLVTERWVAMFRAAGFLRHPVPGRPPRRQSIFRGAHEEMAAGMAWTPSASLAGWYAGRVVAREHRAAAVWIAEPDPADVLAIVTTTAGEEWIVDPAKVEPRRWRAAPHGVYVPEHVEPPSDLEAAS
jgi:hypothetical protein